MSLCPIGYLMAGLMWFFGLSQKTPYLLALCIALLKGPLKYGLQNVSLFVKHFEIWHILPIIQRIFFS